MHVAQAGTIQSAGCVRLDINLLKPSRLEFPDQEHTPKLALPVGHRSCSSPDWLEYIYRTGHPVLRWLPTKLAEWIGENLQEALGFPDKGDVRAGPGSRWTAAELNHFLQAHVVDGTLTTFGCVEWEFEQFRGVIRARCYPFKLPNAALSWREPTGIHRHTIIYRYVHVPVRTSMYQYIPVHTTTSTYHFIPVCTGIMWHVPVFTSTYKYIPVYTGMYWYVLVYTVELWPWQATPGWSDCEGDCRAQGNCAKGPSQSFC